jgi:adenine/guanine/hypoxanthine permease
VPLVGVVPGYATAPALIMVGLFMMKQIRAIDFSDMEHGLPAFIIMVMIAMCYSISTGLAFGFIAYTLIQILTGKLFAIKPAMWIIAILSVLYFYV